MPPVRTPKEIFEDRNSYTAVLLALFLDRFVDHHPEALQQVLSWSADTISLELVDEFKADVPPDNFDKLLAGLALLQSDAYFQSVPDFCQLTLALCDQHIDPQTWVPPTAAECAWGITEALIIAPPEPGQEKPFSDEICHFLGAVLLEEGIMNPPDVLRIANYDPNALHSARSEFSDDPELFAGIHQVQTARSQEIETWLRERLDTLQAQFQTLPLRRRQRQQQQHGHR